MPKLPPITVTHKEWENWIAESYPHPTEDEIEDMAAHFGARDEANEPQDRAAGFLGDRAPHSARPGLPLRVRGNHLGR